MASVTLRIVYLGLLPPHPGGAPISCAELLAGFAALGHRVSALAPITPDTVQQGDEFAARTPGVRVTRFLVPHFDIGPHRPAAEDYRRRERATIRAHLPQMIAQERPNILLIGRETFAWDAPDLARTAGVSSILMIRGGLTLAILAGTYPPALVGPLLAQYRKADLIITPAHFLTEGVRRLGFSHIMTILNAVDLQRFSPGPKDESLVAQLALQPDDVVVVHASNLKPMKRPLDIVHSAEQALQRDPRLIYVIVGDGQSRAALEDACRQRRLTERFRFVGWVDYRRMPDYIRLADLVVMPSEFEAQSRVYLETQACGRVLVASDVPGARDVVVDGETGLLFRVGDVDDLTEKTLRAAGDPALRTAIGRGARERVQAHSFPAAVAEYVAAMQELVQRRVNAAPPPGAF